MVVTRAALVPGQVTGVKVTPGTGRLKVDWNAVSGVDGYKVQWKSGTETFTNAATDSREATVSSGSTTSHTITGLANGTAYDVQVIATLDQRRRRERPRRRHRVRRSRRRVR